MDAKMVGWHVSVQSKLAMDSVLPSFLHAIWRCCLQTKPYGSDLRVPSGKQPHNYGKSPFLMGQLTISMAIFNSKLLVYQRVYLWLKDPISKLANGVCFFCQWNMPPTKKPSTCVPFQPPNPVQDTAFRKEDPPKISRGFFFISGHMNCGDIPWNIGLKNRPYILIYDIGTSVLNRFLRWPVTRSPWRKLPSGEHTKNYGKWP